MKYNELNKIIIRITATGLQRTKPLTLLQDPHETTQLNLNIAKAQRLQYLVVTIFFLTSWLVCLY